MACSRDDWPCHRACNVDFRCSPGLGSQYAGAAAAEADTHLRVTPFVSITLSSYIPPVLTSDRIIPLVVLRLLRLSPSIFHNTPHDITMAGVYTEAAMSFALVAECLTCLKPFLRTFDEGFAPGNAPHYWGDLSQSQTHSGNRSGGGSKPSKPGVMVWQKEAPAWKKYSGRRANNDDMELRTDVSGFSTKIEGRRGVRAEDDMELLPASDIRVQKSMTMSVS